MTSETKSSRLHVVAVIAVDQQLDAAPVLPDQIDGLRYGADEVAQRSAGSQTSSLAPRRRRRGQAARRVLGFSIVPYHGARRRSGCAARPLVTDVATSPWRLQASANGDGARVSCSPAGDHHGRTRLLHRFRFEDASPTWKYRPWKVVRGSVHIFRITDRFLHLPDPRRGVAGTPSHMLVFISRKKPARCRASVVPGRSDRRTPRSWRDARDCDSHRRAA